MLTANHVPDKEQDEYWMRHALACAGKAGEAGEVPVGALVVRDGRLLAAAWNQPIACHDPTAHAETEAIRQACRRVANYRIPGSTLYVTLEPCVMCVGAIVHARISRLVFGASEPKAGAVISRSSLFEAHPFNWHVDIEGGVLADQCADMISRFFQNRRSQRRLQRFAQQEKPKAD